MNEIRAVTDDTLRALNQLLERRPWIALVLIPLLYFPAAFELSRSRPLWHDELFTWYIAQAPTLSTMFADLRSLDLNPPLVYLLTRLSFHLFGVSTLATRLPEMLGFLAALLALFRFVRSRFGVSYALFTVALLMESKIFELAVDARPYTLMLGCFALALMGWQQAAAEPPPRHLPAPSLLARRPAALALTCISVLGMLLSHIFSVVAVAALIAAEWYRQRLRRRLDLPLLGALIAPLLATFTYLPMLRNHHASIFPPAFQPTGETIFEFYIGSVERELTAFCLTGFAVVLLLGRQRKPSAGSLNSPPTQATATDGAFTPYEWFAILGLMAAPLLLLLELMLTHGAFFERYGAVENLAVALLATALLAHWSANRASDPLPAYPVRIDPVLRANLQPDPRAALLGIAIVLQFSGLLSVIPHQLLNHDLIPTFANSEPQPEPCQACLQTAALNPALPLVDASGLVFVEMNRRELPATLTRLFYLTDPAASTLYAHANIFEQMALVVDRFHLAGHTQSYASFVRQHPHFFVLGTFDYPEDWLLRKLLADRANIRLVSRVKDSYRSTELYEVSFAPSPQ